MLRVSDAIDLLPCIILLHFFARKYAWIEPGRVLSFGFGNFSAEQARLSIIKAICEGGDEHVYMTAQHCEGFAYDRCFFLHNKIYVLH